MIRRVLRWPWAQAALWIAGIFAMLIGAGGDYGTNWGPVVVGAVFIGAAIALGFLRVQRQRLEAHSPVAVASTPKPPVNAEAEQPQQVQPVEVVNSAESRSERRRAWWQGALGILVFAVVAAGVRVLTEVTQSPEQQIARMSDQELVERLEREAIANLAVQPTFSRMKQDFPSEYQLLMQELVGVVRRGETEEDAFVVGRNFMARFFERNRSTMQHGSEASLAAFLGAQTDLLASLGSTDPESCAQVIETGQFEPTSGLALVATTSDALNAANTAMFDAIQTGSLAPLNHVSISEAEWIAAFERATALGADTAVLDTLWHA